MSTPGTPSKESGESSRVLKDEELEATAYLELTKVGQFETRLENIIKLTSSLVSHNPEKTSKITVGRAIQNDVVVPSLRVSRHHCEFHETRDGKWILTNLSPNGLLINGAHIPINESKQLADNDKIALLVLGEPVYQFHEPQPLSELKSLQQELLLREKQITMLEVEQEIINFDSVAQEVTFEDQAALKQARQDSEREKLGIVDKLMGFVTESFRCSLCSCVLIDATILGCSHSFCETCINAFQLNGSVCPSCPAKGQGGKFTVKHVVLKNFLDQLYNLLPSKFSTARKQEVDERMEIVTKSKVSSTTTTTKNKSKPTTTVTSSSSGQNGNIAAFSGVSNTTGGIQGLEFLDQILGFNIPQAGMNAAEAQRNLRLVPTMPVLPRTSRTVTATTSRPTTRRGRRTTRRSTRNTTTNNNNSAVIILDDDS